MSAAVAPAPPPAPTTPMTRREFLYYIWIASMALITAETTGAIIWFAIPRFRTGEFGGVFHLDLSAIPGEDSGPKEFADGRFWLVRLGQQSVADPRQPEDYPARPGVTALYKVCVHLGCLYKWVPTNDRFECPCHGSKYLANGVRIDGPARRNLDALVIEILDKDGTVLGTTKTGNADSDDTVGAPLELPATAASIRVDTGRRVQGALNYRPGGGR